MNRQKTQHQYELYQQNIAYLCLLVAQYYFNANYENNEQVQNPDVVQINEVEQPSSQDLVAQKTQDFDSFDHFEYGFADQWNAFEFDDLKYQDDHSKWVAQNQKPEFWNYDIENEYNYNEIPYYDESQCIKERKKIKTDNIEFLQEPFPYMLEENKLQKPQINKAFEDNDNVSTGNDWESSLNLHRKRKKSSGTQSQAGRGSKKKTPHVDLYSTQLSYIRNKQIKNSFTSLIQQEYLEIGQQFQENNWKVVRKKQVLKTSTKLKDKSHKLAISKNESWDVHLKSLRSHFLQNLFTNFENKIWKVPNQKLIKEYAFSGSKEDEKEVQKLQKNSLIEYLEEQKQITNLTYEHFELKRKFYLNAIDMFIFAIQLALECDQMADDIIFELLFKVKIGSLFL